MLMKPVYETVTKMLGAFLLALFITSPNQAQAAAPSEPSDPPPTNGSEEGQQGTSTASDQAQLEAIQSASVAELKATLTQGRARLIVEDSRLEQIASSMAALTLGGGGMDRSGVRLHLWQQGIRDYEFVPLSVRGGPEEILKGLRSSLEDPAGGWDRYNNIGVAVRANNGEFCVALVATRRSMTFVGKGSARDQGYLGGDYESLRLYATDPAGAVSERPSSASDGLWTLDLSTEGEGSWLFEVVGEGPRGPEILALWPQQGSSASRGAGVFERKRSGAAVPDGTPTDAAAWVRGGAPGPNRSPTSEDVVAAETHLWGLIQATRAARGLPALRAIPAVVQAARAHAMDIGRGDQFGHHTSSGGALDRLAAQGVLASRVVENVGRAADVAEVHAALLASPAHRANLLDEEVSAGGIGVVLQRDSRGRWSAIVSEVFVELLTDAATREEELVQDIHRIREEAGLLRLKLSSLLSREARTAAEQIASSGGLDLSAEARQLLVDQIRFHFVSTGRVGIDLMVTNDTDAGADIHHVRGPTYDEVGVGAARLEQRIGTHPPGTLVSVFVFLER